jgi:hypothetical protein
MDPYQIELFMHIAHVHLRLKGILKQHGMDSLPSGSGLMLQLVYHKYNWYAETIFPGGNITWYYYSSKGWKNCYQPY